MITIVSLVFPSTWYAIKGFITRTAVGNHISPPLDCWLPVIHQLSRGPRPCLLLPTATETREMVTTPSLFAMISELSMSRDRACIDIDISITHLCAHSCASFHEMHPFVFYFWEPQDTLRIYGLRPDVALMSSYKRCLLLEEDLPSKSPVIDAVRLTA